MTKVIDLAHRDDMLVAAEPICHATVKLSLPKAGSVVAQDWLKTGSLYPDRLDNRASLRLWFSAICGNNFC